MMKIAIVWVNDYKNRDASSPTSPDCAGKFVRVMGQDFQEYSEDRAFDALFQGTPQSPPEINTFDFVYFAGHGGDDGPIFNRLDKNDGVVQFNESDVDLGGSLRIAVFDCCRALKRGELWRKRFNGLRWLLGFPDDMQPSETRGEKFAKHLLDGRTINEAWKRAVKETDQTAPYASVRALESDSGEIPEDLLSGLPARTAPRFFISSVERVEPPSEVKLYEVGPPGWTGESLKNICERLVVPGSPQEETEDFYRFGAGALDVFRASDSLWWMRARLRRVLFGEAPTLPPPNEAIAQALSFLGEKQFLPGAPWRIWTTRTVEVHQDAAESRRKEILTARHVHVIYHLDGLPVVGPGAKTCVSFESEKVDAFHQFWQRPIPVGSINIIDAEQAKEALAEDETFRQVKDRLQLGDPQLGYYALPARQRPDYLLPVWIISGKVAAVLASEVEYRFVRYVRAAATIPEAVRDKLTGSVFGLKKVLP